MAGHDRRLALPRLQLGIGVVNTGHAHPRVVAAIQAQAARLIHGQQNIVFHEAGLRLYERLPHVRPGSGWGVFLSNSGAEAVEAAVKLARVATGRPAIIAFRGGFHGRTAQTMALTSSRVTVRGDFEPLPGSVYHTRISVLLSRGRRAARPSACTCDWETQLETLFAQMSTPGGSRRDRRAGPRRGRLHRPAAGLPAAPARDHATARHAAHGRRGADGLRPTGRLWAVEHWDVTPDILAMAKGIASGLPLSGVMARRELTGRWAPGAHGGTYGGNVVVCAAANATLDVIADEGLWRTRPSADSSCWTASARSATGHRRLGTCAASAAWWPSSSSSASAPTADAGAGPRQTRPRRGAQAEAACSSRRAPGVRSCASSRRWSRPPRRSIGRWASSAKRSRRPAPDLQAPDPPAVDAEGGSTAKTDQPAVTASRSDAGAGRCSSTGCT